MRSFYLGTFLVSASALFFQIALTRILSISQFYHFAFMVISLALLGFGASGSFLWAAQRLTRKIDRFLGTASILFSVSTTLSYVLINVLPFDSYKICIEPAQLFIFTAYYIVLSLPFFFVGLILGALLSRFPASANTIYFFNLLGSGVGCLLAIVILGLISESNIAPAASIIGLFASLAFTGKQMKLKRLSLLLLAFFVLIFLSSPPFLKLKISPYKALSSILRFPNSKIQLTLRGAASRVDVINSPHIHYAPGLSPVCPELPSQQCALTIDGQNLSAIAAPQSLEFTDFLPTALAYKLGGGGKNVLIINPRGGLPVIGAIYQGAHSITVVEDNLEVAKIMRRRLYDKSDIRLITKSARSFAGSTRKKFDVITVPIQDEFGAVTTGAFSLKEDYLHTVEAVGELFSLLNEGGVLTIGSWLQMPPSESMRLGSTILEALSRLEIDNPSSHISAIRGWITAAYLIKKEPFTPQDIQTIRDFCRKRRFDVFHLPGVRKDEVNVYNSLPEPLYYNGFKQLLDAGDRADFCKAYSCNICPVWDNSPFFFHFFRWAQVPDIIRGFGKEWKPFGGGGYLVILFLLMVSLILSAVFILLPLRIGKRPKMNSPRLFIYFAGLGLGYLIIEICLIHQFILFLDHPVYSFAVVLSSMLFFSGIGSLLSRRLNSPIIFKLLAVLLCIFVFVYLKLIPCLFGLFLGKCLFVRMLLSLLILAPLSILMGIPFPTGIRMVGRLSPRLVPWIWAINGCASVVGSVFAMMLVLQLGYASTHLIAGLIYVTAFISVWPRGSFD